MYQQVFGRDAELAVIADFLTAMAGSALGRDLEQQQNPDDGLLPCPEGDQPDRQHRPPPFAANKPVTSWCRPYSLVPASA
jgi:hypothetical protein